MLITYFILFLIFISMLLFVLIFVKKIIMKYKLREHQVKASVDGLKILTSKKIVYLVMQVRTGKTATALEIAKNYGAKKVLFLTVKKAINEIEKDYKDNFDYHLFFDLKVTNDEAIHKIECNDFDLVIHDEHHRYGAYPVFSKRSKLFKDKFSHLPMIFLSGTPTPESYSQFFHQFFVSKFTPFTEVNFYQWAKKYVNIQKINIGNGFQNNYSKANFKKINEVIGNYLVNLSQEDAGFSSGIKEHFLICEMSEKTKLIINSLKKNKIVKGKSGYIVADTVLKEMQKIHQIGSGTSFVQNSINEFDNIEKKAVIIDDSKARFIKDKFREQKIVIFYKFKSELQLLKQFYKDDLTEEINEFNNTNKNIALQIKSGSQGINLSKADSLVYFNLDFSAMTYWQSRDRLTTKERINNNVFFIFSDCGIERYIYKAIEEKKNYTLTHFKNNYK